jgi:signal transduction histidine kinase
MQSAPIPIDEAERQRALDSYRVLDTLTEEAYDDLTALAAEICKTPIALISLIDNDRQWFKSHHGLDAREMPRDVAFCAHAILQQDFFEVCDSRKDARFSDNPLVTEQPNVTFYGGAVLATDSGNNLGTLCVIDHKPRQLSGWQKRCLTIIAKQVVSLLELRKAIFERAELDVKNQRSRRWIEHRQQELARFAYRSSHDLRAPAIQIQSLAELVGEDLLAGRQEEALVNATRLREISQQLLAFIDGVVEVGRAELLDDAEQLIDFELLIAESVTHIDALMPQHAVAIRSELLAEKTLKSEYLRLRQMLVQLLSNSIMYANLDAADPHVRVRVEDTTDGIAMSVSDNGIGIPPEHQPNYFDMFSRFHPQLGAGSGVGTTIIHKHALAIGARLELQSSPAGTTVSVLFPDRAKEARCG